MSTQGIDAFPEGSDAFPEGIDGFPVAPTARRLYRRRLGGNSRRASEPLAEQPAS